MLGELLRTKRIDSKEKLLCKRPLRIGSLRLDCSHAPEVKELDAEEAIAYSCNSYLAEASLRLDRQELTGSPQSRIGFADAACRRRSGRPNLLTAGDARTN